MQVFVTLPPVLLPDTPYKVIGENVKTCLYFPQFVQDVGGRTEGGGTKTYIFLLPYRPIQHIEGTIEYPTEDKSSSFSRYCWSYPILYNINMIFKTPKQLFWLSAANTWCAVYRNEAIKLRITTGFHAPGRFRVIGPLSNMVEFQKDFACPAGSPMNPPEKCKVW